MTANLVARQCKPCEGGVEPMTDRSIALMLAEVSGWEQVDGHIERTFQFESYVRTISFVNAVAWMADREGHHPDLEVGFRECRVKFHTHAIERLSENDFICAAKVNQIHD